MKMKQNGYQLVHVFRGINQEDFLRQHEQVITFNDFTSGLDKNDFPWNCLKQIRDQVIADKCVLIANHSHSSQIQDGLTNMGLSVLAVYPHNECKEECKAHYMKQIDSSWVGVIFDLAWEEMIPKFKEMKTDKIQLLPGQTLSDVLYYSQADNLIRVK